MKACCIRTFIIGLFCLSTLAATLGCATPAKITHHEPKDIIQAGNAYKSRPIQFKKVVVKLKRGESIGSWQIGGFCIPNGQLHWLRGGRVQINSEEFSDIFKEELVDAGFEVVGDPNALFEDPSEWKAEILVAGMIRDLKINVCYPWAGFGNFSTASGEAAIKVDWHIYSRLERKVIAKITTTGDHERTDAIAGGEAEIWLDAFAEACQNLLAEKKFYDIVSASPQTQSAHSSSINAVKKKKTFHLVKQKSSQKLVKDHISDIRASIVTIYAGGGHGSGFVVSKDGLILTNEHVVREAKLVKIKLATGLEILGQVIETNARRDVALIKAEKASYFALPIRHEAAQIGEEAYAVGSPLSTQLSTTLTKGIISAYREIHGERYIQSDVSIYPGNSGGPLIDANGNVLGITVSGIQQGGSSTALNFFIPIDSALQALGMDLQ